MNKTSSKEASTLSCLQKSSYVLPAHRSFQFLLPGTFYSPFFRVSSISFPLTSHHQSTVLHSAALSPERNDLMGAPPKASKTPQEAAACLSLRRPSTLQDKLEGGTTRRCIHRENIQGQQNKNLPLILPQTQKTRCVPNSRKEKKKRKNQSL